MAQHTTISGISTVKQIEIDMDNLPLNIPKLFLKDALAKDDVTGEVFELKLLVTDPFTHEKTDVDLLESGDGITGKAYFVRSDGKTKEITGVRSFNTIYDAGGGYHFEDFRMVYSLPAECYAVAGPFKLYLKITMNNITKTMMIIEGNVVETKTATTV